MEAEEEIQLLGAKGKLTKRVNLREYEKAGETGLGTKL